MTEREKEDKHVHSHLTYLSIYPVYYSSWNERHPKVMHQTSASASSFEDHSFPFQAIHFNRFITILDRKQSVGRKQRPHPFLGSWLGRLEWTQSWGHSPQKNHQLAFGTPNTCMHMTFQMQFGCRTEQTKQTLRNRRHATTSNMIQLRFEFVLLRNTTFELATRSTFVGGSVKWIVSLFARLLNFLIPLAFLLTNRLSCRVVFFSLFSLVILLLLISVSVCVWFFFREVPRVSGFGVDEFNSIALPTSHQSVNNLVANEKHACVRRFDRLQVWVLWFSGDGHRAHKK